MTILSKQYPMDLGTGSIEQVRQSAPKIDMELGAIYGHLNNIRTRYRSATAPVNPEAGQVWEDTVNAKVMKWNGSAWVEDIAKSVNLTNRNTVLQGQVSSAGALELILGSTVALTASLVSSAIDTIIAIPAGHDDVMGNSDYIVSFSATQTDFWTSLPATNTSYLFVDYSGGTVTGVYSVIAPVYQSYAPAHSAGKNWFDTNREQWYLSDGSNWVAKYRCYVGYVVTDGTKVTATTIEPYNRIRANIIGTASLDVPLSYLDTDGALAANSDSKIATQKAVKTYVDANAGSGASIGTGNYIAEPFAVTAGTGLEVSVAANRCVIDETVCELTTATTVALTAKAAQLIYKKKDNTYDKLLPKMTAADLVDANTVGLWFPDGSASVPNAAVGVNGNTLAVANALTKSGTITAVDGWAGGDAAKGDGSTGYYTSANSTGFPTGTNNRHFTCELTVNESTADRYVGGFGYSTPVMLMIGSLQIYVYVAGNQATGFYCEVGKTYLLDLVYDGTKYSLYVNGQLVWTYTASHSLDGAVLRLLSNVSADAGTRAGHTLHFVRLQNSSGTPAQIAALAQKLLIPCSYKTGLVEFKNTNMATRLEAAFDQTTAQGYAAAAYGSNVAFGRIGGRFSAPVGMQSVTVYGSTDYGFSYDNSHNVSMTLTLFGTNDWSSFTDVSTQTIINSGSYWGTAQPVVTFNAPAGSYLYWGVKVALTSGANCWPSVAEFVYTLSNAVQTDIRDALANPAESQIVCFTRTDATKPVLIIAPNDPEGPTPERAYGMPIGPNGVMNRRKRLGRKYFSGSATPEWDSPFGSRDMTIDAEWSLDAAGTNSSLIPNDAANSYPSVLINGKIRETITTGVLVAGASKTSGYIDIIAEVA